MTPPSAWTEEQELLLALWHRFAPRLPVFDFTVWTDGERAPLDDLAAYLVRVGYLTQVRPYVYRLAEARSD